MARELLKSACAMAAACTALLCVPRALAQPEQSRSATIMLTYDPSVAQGAPTIDAVKAHLSSLRIEMLVEPVSQTGSSLSERLEISGELAAQHQALGAFSIEVGPTGEVLVFFTEPQGRSALIRRIRTQSQDLSVVREQAAIVVRSMVQALLEGKRIGMTSSATSAEPTPPRNAERRAPPPRPQRPRRQPAQVSRDDETQARAEPRSTARVESQRRVVAAGAGYSGTRLAPELGWQSGMVLELRWFVMPPIYLGSSYTLFPSQDAAIESATIALTRHPIEVALGYEDRASFSPTVEVSALLDVIHRSTLSAGADYQRTPDENQLLLGVGLRGGISWGPVEWVRVSARAGGDLAVRRISFVSERDGTETLVETSFLSPKVLMSLSAYLP